MQSQTEVAQEPRNDPRRDAAALVAGLERHPAKLSQLFQAVLEINSDLALPVLLQRIVEIAVSLAECRFGALGIVGTGEELSEFITVGMDPHGPNLVGPAPLGRGALGHLIAHPEPIRLSDLATYPGAYGFPAHHPKMKSFLGVPIRVHQSVFGNLYLTEKNGGGDFTEYDEQLVLALATAAGMAIANARLYTEADLHRRWLQASASISNALFSGEDPDGVLPVIAAQARKLTVAQAAFIAFPDADSLVIEAVDTIDSIEPDGLLGLRLPIAGTLLGTALTTGQPATSARATRHSAKLSRAEESAFGKTLAAVPLGRDTGHQAVLAIIASEGGPHFEASTLPMLDSFATQAALALETAERRHDTERLVMFEERDRIARDLHDLVIQRLFACGMHLENTAKLASNEEISRRIHAVVDDLDLTIQEIRATIFALKTQPKAPSSSLRAAILAVVEQCADRFNIAPSVQLDGLPGTGLPPSITNDLLVVAREALSNAARHARANQVQVIVHIGIERVALQVIDDGVGFDDTAHRSGLANLADRAQSHGGEFSVRHRPEGGTSLSWSVPL